MRILIFGAGKSGTTALFYNVKKQFPGYVGDFEPVDLSYVDYSQSNLIVKSINVYPWQEERIHFPKYDCKILMIRHPFDRLISFLLYAPHNGMGFSNDQIAATYLNLLKKKTADPSSVKVIEIANLYQQITGLDFIQEFHNQHNCLIGMSHCKECNFKILKYEDFIDRKLNDIHEYLGVALTSTVEVAAEHKRVERSKKHSDWKNWFLEDDIEYFSHLFFGFNQEFSYHTSIESGFKPIIHPEESFHYAIRVINNYRHQHCLPEYCDGEITLQEEGSNADFALYAAMRGNTEHARYLIEQSIRIKPNLLGLYLIKAEILLVEGKQEEALLQVKHALELDPQVSIPLTLLEKVGI